MKYSELLTLFSGWGFVYGQGLIGLHTDKAWAEAMAMGASLVALFSDSTESTRAKLLDSFLKGVAEVL